MRIDRPFRTPLLALTALLIIVPVLVGTAASSSGSPALPDGATGEGTGPADLVVVERQVSGDMVVDWLEEPPADAADWVATSEASVEPASPSHADHDHDHADDETFQAEAASAQGSSTEQQHHAAASPEQGFAVFSTSPRWLPTGYTIRLTGSDARIEQYRADITAAAAVAEATGGRPVRVADGMGGSASPSRGEITVVLGTGTCGSTALGCGGPAMTKTDLVSGRVWISPAALSLSAADRASLAAHELGHALGLQHYSPDFTDGRQAMYPTITGVSSYRSGDLAGLKFMAGGYDTPAGTVAERSYAAGHMRVAGTLASGTRVRIAVGDRTEDVTASGGKFAAAIAAPAGTHNVCATVLDAAAGFRRALGCTPVAAAGTPFGAFDAAKNSFETVRLSGWAIDPQTADPVDVEVRRNGTVVTTVPADGERKDVGNTYPHYGARHAYNLQIPAVAGINDVCVRILGVGGGGDKDLGCKRVHHAVDPVGAFEVAVGADLGATVAGWALDPNTASPVNVTVTVDGAVPAVPGVFRAADHRADVARNYPAHGPAHGFSQRLVLTAGDHELCLVVGNVGLGQDRTLGCTVVSVQRSADVRPVTGVAASPQAGVVSEAVGTVAGVLDPIAP